MFGLKCRKSWIEIYSSIKEMINLWEVWMWILVGVMVYLWYAYLWSRDDL